MELQVKLYKVFNNTKEDTLNRLYDCLGRDRIYEINRNILAIKYDYSKCTLKELKSILNKINIEEVKIINEMFYSIISNSVKSDFIIQNINLRDSIDGFDETIKECIDKIDYTSEFKEDMLDDLIYELEWVSSEEYIDIDKIDIRIKKEDEWIPINMNRSGEVLLNSKVIDIFRTLIIDCI